MLFETFPTLKLGLNFRKNMSTVNKFIGYVDLMGCHKIWSTHSEDNHKQNVVDKFCYL